MADVSILETNDRLNVVSPNLWKLLQQEMKIKREMEKIKQ